MSENIVELEQVVAQALTLSPLDRVRLIEQVLATLKQPLKDSPSQSRRSLLGVLSSHGTAPSAQEIDDARHEAWENFPREDI